MSTVPTTHSAADELQSLLDAIPIADDGAVIVPEYHNTLRAAFAHLAHAIGGPAQAPVLTRSYPPTLWPAGAALTPAPIGVTGAAELVATSDWGSYPQHALPLSSNAAGWMPTELPDGTDVDVLTVRGERGIGHFDRWSFGLYRLALAGFTWGGAGWARVCEGEVPTLGIDPPGPSPSIEDNRSLLEFVLTLAPSVSGLTPAQAAALRRVDTSRYRYVFLTRLSGSATPKGMMLQLIQVTCTRPGA